MSTPAFHEDLHAVVEAVEILSPTRYTLLGHSREVPDGDSSEGEGPRLVSSLVNDLYAWLYIRPSYASDNAPADALTRRAHLARLSEANRGQGTWESGWQFLRFDPDGRIVVSRDEIAFWAPASAVRLPDDSPRPGGVRRRIPALLDWGKRVRLDFRAFPAEVVRVRRNPSAQPTGGNCRVRVGKEVRQRLEGWYIALGDVEPDEGDRGSPDAPSVRYYWHLTADAAVPFLEAVTSRLNAARIPFWLKVPVDASWYHRADAGVLIVSPRDAAAIGPILAETHAAVASGLRPPVPLFTKRLADGLGYAQSPPGPSSFGGHRCDLAAEALWQSFLRGEVDREARVATIAARFLAGGIDPQRPYLGTDGRADDVVLPIVRGTDPSGSFPAVIATPMTPIEAAARIGASLCQSAYWDDSGRLCNWIGRCAEGDSRPVGSLRPTATNLGPDLYDGSAGVALFLARLHAMTGEPESRRTALGAIRRSIRQLDRATSPSAMSRCSFFRGDIGIAYAACQVGELTGETGLVGEGVAILDRAAAPCPDPHPLDVMGGNAGAIPALLDLARRPGFERCLDRAIAMGEELCRSATREDGVCSWNPDVASRPGMAEVPLAGLTHGAAGIGLALFELHAATGRADFLELARGAFAYEALLFYPERKNWPDLRLQGRPATGKPTARFALAWCQGAPGIALTRLRAMELDPAREELYRATAFIAIESTFAAVAERLDDPRADATPCHGLSGLMEVVLVAGQMLGDGEYLAWAREVGRILIDRHAAAGDWPSGAASGGPNPSLMLGSAGVGYSLLRLHAPEEVPSVLLIRPSPGAFTVPGGST